jgi:hypothetical protein
MRLHEQAHCAIVQFCGSPHYESYPLGERHAPLTVARSPRGWNFDPLARDVLIWLEQSGLKEATFIGVPAVDAPAQSTDPDRQCRA